MNEQKIWNFASESIPGKYYTIQKVNGKLVCNCPTCIFTRGRQCRHIRLVSNNLAGVAINREPELMPADVKEITLNSSEILVPLIKSDLHKYSIVRQLRELGISKKRCEAYVGQRMVSDKAIEKFLAENSRFNSQKAYREVPAFALVRC